MISLVHYVTIFLVGVLLFILPCLASSFYSPPSSTSHPPRCAPRPTSRSLPGREESEEEGADLAPLLGPVPLVAIPVIAGVGSEVTPMATILDDKDPLEPKKVRRKGGRGEGGRGGGGLRLAYISQAT